LSMHALALINIRLACLRHRFMQAGQSIFAGG
jgi:hypothetical protein